MRAYKVLFFGPSTLFYSETTPEGTLLKLIQARLAEARPDVAFECAGSVLYLSPGMAARVRSVIERERPDLVLLRPPSMQILNDYVIYRVRERWPRLYRFSTRVSEASSRLAGGGPDGAPGARGWFFRGPRWLLARLVGVAPALRPEAAAAVIRETLDTLRVREHDVVYMLPSVVIPPNVPDAEAERRLRAFAAGLAEYCRERDIPLIDPMAEMAKLGVRRRPGRDRWHVDIDGRKVDARLVAGIILSRYGLATGR